MINHDFFLSPYVFRLMILFLEVSYTYQDYYVVGSFIFKTKILEVVFVTRTAVESCHESVQQTYNHQNQKDHVNGLSRLEVLTRALQRATAEKNLDCVLERWKSRRRTGEWKEK